MKLIFKKDLIIYMPFLLAVSMFSKYSLVYIPFILVLIKDIYLINKKKNNVEKFLFKNLVYSVMLPDNFIVIFFTGLLFLYFVVSYLRNKKRLIINKSFMIIFILLISMFMINIVIHRVPINNIFLYLMYNFVFAVVPIVFMAFNVEEYETIDKALNTAIIMQGISILAVVIFNIHIVMDNLFGDWSIGTMGVSQGVQLFSLMIFTAVKLLSKYLKTKQYEYLIFFIIATLLSLSTVSLTNTAIFFVSIIAFFVVYKLNRKVKLMMVGVIAVLMCIFWFGSDPFVREQFTKIAFNSEFRVNRVKKLETYEDTYISLPKKDLKAGLIGVGAGNYSSRAALTASGYYTSWYNSSRFKTSINKYARKYIRPRIFSNIGVSLLETPTSQYISIMGEYGYIGVAVFAAIAILVFIKSGDFNKLLILYFLMTCFFDNYFEYPKIMLTMYLCCFIIKKDNEIMCENS